ncbi:MAG: hypothetical protein JO107_09595, partial [Hyphomicrobiales bacterium]|nr:hypothetical protein [Hyphomicrobiales bacterium]MBV8663342.1 hypothetical protein [Hyphomicrobiales bacterium]
MQSDLAQPGSSVISSGGVAEVDAELRRTLDRAAPARPAASKKTLRERMRRLLLIAFPVLMTGAGLGYYLAEEPYVTTDDAYVRAAKESVNARVAGQVIEIDVSDNQRVQRG